MKSDVLGLLFFLVALLAVVAMARYYVLGVIERDRVVSRFAVVCFLVFAVAAVWSLVGGPYVSVHNKEADALGIRRAAA